MMAERKISVRAVFLLIVAIALGVFISSEKRSYTSKEADNAFRNLIAINDINSGLLLEHISIEWFDTNGYKYPEIIVRVKNLSEDTIHFSSDASVTVSVYMVADDRWIKIGQNNDVHFINNGEELILHPQNTLRERELFITVWPILGYATEEPRVDREWEKVVRILVVGELVSDDQKSPVGAFIDIPYRK